jgi:hypothetical protein
MLFRNQCNQTVCHLTSKKRYLCNGIGTGGYSAVGNFDKVRKPFWDIQRLLANCGLNALVDFWRNDLDATLVCSGNITAGHFLFQIYGQNQFVILAKDIYLLTPKRAKCLYCSGINDRSHAHFALAAQLLPTGKRVAFPPHP